MGSAPRLRVTLLLLGLATLPGAAQIASRPVMMSDLTVPKDRLPEGCSLKVIEPGRQPLGVTPAQNGQGIQAMGRFVPWMQPPGVTVNPWTGTNRSILAQLRRGIDGYEELRLPDAPPLTASEASSIFAQFADGVQEGYAATYAQNGASDVGVWAVKFTETPETYFDFPWNTHRRQSSTVITIGVIRMALFGDNGACSTAIETYLKSLGK